MPDIDDISRQKQIRITKQLIKNAAGEESLGNLGAAQLFLEKVEEKKLKYNITDEDLIEKSDVVDIFINELGKTIISNSFVRSNAKVVNKMVWYDSLAEVVANGYSCIAKNIRNTNDTIFYGYDTDREISIFMFQRISIIASDMAKLELTRAKKLVGVKDFRSNKVTLETWMGDELFIDSFHAGFREALKETYKKHNIDNIKFQEVEAYYEQNVSQDSTYTNYNNFSINTNNEYAFNVGKRAGNLSITHASKSNTSVTTKSKTNDDFNKDRLWLLIDRSGSMYGDKLEQAKHGALDFAKGVNNKGFMVGVIDFGSNVNLTIKATNEVNGKFEKQLQNIRVSGMTNLTDAIKMTRAYFPNKRVKRTICIITDGQPDDEQTALMEANNAKRDGIKIMAIGVDGAKQSFLDDLTSEKGLGLLVERNQLALTIGSMANKV